MSKINPTSVTDALSRLEDLLADEENKSRPPVHLWNPPTRPDIGLAIQRDGTWTHEGSPFHRANLVKLFASVLRRDDDGRHYVVTPVEKVPVRVVDAPFMAVEMQVRGKGERQELIWRTNVDDVVLADVDHPIRFVPEPPDGGLKPYVLVRDSLEARVTRAVYYDLVNLATTETVNGVEHFGVWSGGAFFPMTDAASLAAQIDPETAA